MPPDFPHNLEDLEMLWPATKGALAICVVFYFFVDQGLRGICPRRLPEWHGLVVRTITVTALLFSILGVAYGISFAVGFGFSMSILALALGYATPRPERRFIIFSAWTALLTGLSYATLFPAVSS
jgi:hypothetical protein